MTTRPGDKSAPSSPRPVHRPWLKLQMRPAQAFRIANIPMITNCFDAQNSPQITGNYFGREIDDGFSESGNIINDGGRKKIDSTVGEIPRRACDLFMKSHDCSSVIQLQDSTGRRIVGAEAKHGHDVTRWPVKVCLDKAAHVEIGQVVGVGDQEILALKPGTIG